MTNEDIDEHKIRVRQKATEAELAKDSHSQGFPRWLRIAGAIALVGGMAAFAVARNRRKNQ